MQITEVRVAQRVRIGARLALVGEDQGVRAGVRVAAAAAARDESRETNGDQASSKAANNSSAALLI